MTKTNKSKIALSSLIVGLALCTIQESKASVTLTWGAQIGDTFALASSTLGTKAPVAIGSFFVTRLL